MDPARIVCHSHTNMHSSARVTEIAMRTPFNFCQPCCDWFESVKTIDRTRYCVVCQLEKETIFDTDVYCCEKPGCRVMHRVCHGCVNAMIRGRLLQLHNFTGELPDAIKDGAIGW